MFDPHEFHRFLRALRIDSKERGMISLGDNLNGAQIEFMQRVERAFERDVHEFVVLKIRQTGLSTISNAFDLYWPSKHTGITGSLVTHDDAARDQFRTTLQLYRSGLAEEWQREVLDDNRNQLVFENGSKLLMRVAGTKRKAEGSSKLGRSGALVYAHCTETAYWGDATSIQSLRASFAEHNPRRCFIWESTANGFNHYHDMWEEAKRASSIEAIFIGWWLNEYYSLGPDHPLYARYWGAAGRLTKEEREHARMVKRLYGYDVNPMQVAWYRYMAAEKVTDAAQLAQDYPWHEEMAFIASGSAFFRTLTLTQVIREIKKQGLPTTYRVETGAQFWETRVVAARGAKATLTVWEEPQPGGWYVVGCDPAYASSENAAASAISVWRVWYNRAEQVAEFCDNECGATATAWVLAYLAGWYGNSTTNIEINGPGMAVLQALRDLQRQASSPWEGDRAESVRKVVSCIRHYVFRKPDTFSGMLQAWHTKTTFEVKERMLNAYRDYIERGMIVVRSMELVNEMKAVVREGGSAPAAPAGKNDDRVIAAALACMTWTEQLRAQLLAQGVIWKPPTVATPTEAAQDSVAERMVQNYFQRIGLTPSDSPPPKRPMHARGREAWNPTRRRPEKPADERPNRWSLPPPTPTR